MQTVPVHVIDIISTTKYSYVIDIIDIIIKRENASRLLLYDLKWKENGAYDLNNIVISKTHASFFQTEENSSAKIC